VHFKDIVPKPDQEIKNVFTKESFNELPDKKKWDHAIEPILDSQEFSTKVYPLCEGYTTPYNESPIPGALLATMATTLT